MKWTVSRLAKNLVADTAKAFIPFPYFRGARFAKAYGLVSRTQYYPAEKLREFQEQKLASLVKHAYKNMPYYKRLFEKNGLLPSDVRSIEDLRKLPFLMKDEVRRSSRLLCARNMRRYFPVPIETGGTTGKPLRIYGDARHLDWHIAVVWRYRNWAGFSYGDRWVEMRYRFSDLDQRTRLGVHYSVKGNTLYLSSFHLSQKTLLDYIKLLKKFRPKALYGFPSMLYVLARYILSHELKVDVNIIFTSSETLFSWQREAIEKAFSCKVFDFYGSNEGVISAAQCPEGSYHVDCEVGILEVVDNEGKAVDTGNVGFVVATGLHHYAMPLIRYRLGDLVRLSKSPCCCGKTLPVIESIEGRTDDAVVTGDGRLVGRLDEAFHLSYGIRETQIIQKEVGKIVVKVVQDDGFSLRDVKVLDDELKKRLGASTVIDYEYVESIPRTAMGKYKFVVSEVASKHLNEIVA